MTPTEGESVMQQTRIISVRGLTRIFEGELVPQRTRGGGVNHYRVRGLRFEDSATLAAIGGAVDESSRSSSDARGIYFASVVLRGVARKGGYHSFFPRDWTQALVVKAVEAAYQNKQQINWVEAGNFFEGRTPDGMRVLLELDEVTGQVIDAFPRREKLKPNLEALWRIQRGRQKRSKLVCSKCQSLKVLICPKWHDAPRKLGWVERVRRWWRQWWLA